MLKHKFIIFWLVLSFDHLTACSLITVPSRDQAYLDARTAPVLPISTTESSNNNIAVAILSDSRSDSGQNQPQERSAISVLPPKD